MDEQVQCAGGALRALVALGLAMSIIGGLVIALSWERHEATVLGGALLAASGQVLALLGLAGRGTLDPPLGDRVG
ncbi:hypothetical protein [Nocardioides coralli]|uniref:hypothetical protein n=1 Tax=Nocardioides coralli TaxID=2872154 RepID=UPI001CA3FCFB|nr:hypothetical protein [Nocardioides coralli]QZY29127.1 hypothetical protein K6T13_17140 [Nocardioides coralli]